MRKNEVIRKPFNWAEVNMNSSTQMFTDDMLNNVYVYTDGKALWSRTVSNDPTVHIGIGRKGLSVRNNRGVRNLRKF